MPVSEGLCGTELGSVTLQSEVAPHSQFFVQERAPRTVEEFPQTTAHLFLRTPIYGPWKSHISLVRIIVLFVLFVNCGNKLLVWKHLWTSTVMSQVAPVVHLK